MADEDYVSNFWPFGEDLRTDGDDTERRGSRRYVTIPLRFYGFILKLWPHSMVQV